MGATAAGGKGIQRMTYINGNLSDNYEDSIESFYYPDFIPSPFSLLLEFIIGLTAFVSCHRDLNRLVMDYLVVEGYRSAAEEFGKEANLAAPVDLDSIERRMNIRDAIYRGDVEDAIEKVNDLNPEILETNPSLYFHLQQQKLIEHIRHGRTTEALVFAQSELAPRSEENPEFLSELERTMALLAFESTPNPPAAVAELLHPSQRIRTASELNAAILDSLSQGKEVKLVGLMKLLCWAESILEEHVEFPKINFDSAMADFNAS